MIFTTFDGVTGVRYIELLITFVKKFRGFCFCSGIFLAILGPTLTKKSLNFSATACLSSVTDPSDNMNLVCLIWSPLFYL